MKRFSTQALVLTAGLLLALGCSAQMPKPETVVQLRVEPAVVKGKGGRPLEATLVAVIQKGFHVNSHQPVQDYLIPTRVVLAEPGPFVLEKTTYPEGELKSFGFAPDEKLSVYDGTVKIPVRLRSKPRAPAGTHTLRLAFHYQACNDQYCLRPTRRDVALQVQLQ